MCETYSTLALCPLYSAIYAGIPMYPIHNTRYFHPRTPALSLESAGRVGPINYPSTLRQRSSPLKPQIPDIQATSPSKLLVLHDLTLWHHW